MGKYYVSSGNCQQVVQATDPDGAALWALHSYLEEKVDLAAVDWSDETLIDMPDLMDALFSLGEEFCVSERGLGRADVGVLDTATVMNEWQQLMVAVARIGSQSPDNLEFDTDRDETIDGNGI